VSLLTFHERLTADAVLPAFLRAELGLESATSVYVGTLPRETQEQVADVRIEPAAPEPRGEDAAGFGTEHRYEIWCWHRSAAQPDKSGATLFQTVDELARLVVRALDGRRPFATELPDLVVCSAAVEDATPIEEPDRDQRIVAATFLVRGTGDVDQGAGDEDAGGGGGAGA
jgi:hypothetical protein